RGPHRDEHARPHRRGAPRARLGGRAGPAPRRGPGFPHAPDGRDDREPDGGDEPRREPRMRVKDLIRGRPITIGRETPVLEARRIMQTRQIRHLLVVEYGRLVGIVTDRDIRLNMPSPATTLSVWEVNYLLARLTVGEVMTTPVIIVDP